MGKTNELSQMRHAITIRCSRCNKKIFRYYKRTPGKLWHLWKSNVVEDLSRRRGEKVLCPKCGAVIGVEKKAYIKLIKGSYTY